MGVPWGMIGTLGGEGTCAPSPRAAQAGQESSPAHPSWHMAHRSNDLPVPTLGLAAPPCQGPHPKGLHPCGGSRQQPACPQLGQESGVSSQTLEKRFCSSLLPPPPKEAAEILLSLVLLHLGCKNRKNPTMLTGTSPASESIFPASAGKKKKIGISSRAWGSMQGEKRDAWPRAHRCLEPGLSPSLLGH